MKISDGVYLSELNEGLVFKTVNGVNTVLFKGQELNYIAPRTCTEQNSNDDSIDGDISVSTKNRNKCFANSRQEFLDALLVNMRSRFLHEELLDSMQISDPAAYPEDSQELNQWRYNHLRILQNYGQRQQNRDKFEFDAQRIRFKEFDAHIGADIYKGEFLPFKRLLNQNRGEKSSEGEITVVHSSTKMVEISFDNRALNRKVFAQILN